MSALLLAIASLALCIALALRMGSLIYRVNELTGQVFQLQELHFDHSKPAAFVDVCGYQGPWPIPSGSKIPSFFPNSLLDRSCELLCRFDDAAATINPNAAGSLDIDDRKASKKPSSLRFVTREEHSYSISARNPYWKSCIRDWINNECVSTDEFALLERPRRQVDKSDGDNSDFDQSEVPNLYAELAPGEIFHVPGTSSDAIYMATLLAEPNASCLESDAIAPKCPRGIDDAKNRSEQSDPERYAFKVSHKNVSNTACPPLGTYILTAHSGDGLRLIQPTTATGHDFAGGAA